MLWSLLKIVVFVVLVAALTLGAGFLMESSGGMMITVAGTEYTLGALQSVIALLVLVVALYVAFKVAGLLVALLRFINGDETALSRYFDRNRERKGFQALSEGIMALASGEGRLAMAKASKAEKYLHRPELTDLVTAQAAEMSGDRKKAEEVYKRLVTRDETRFVGIRGLMKQKLAAGDTDTALKLAERAFAIKPRHVEVQDTLLRLQAEKADYVGARATLAEKLKQGSLPRDVYRRRDAVLALSSAQAMEQEGHHGEANDAAIRANKASPDLIPAAAMAARAYTAQGNKRYATKVLKKAWAANPHPDLAAAYAEIEPGESASDRVRRFGTLTSINPDHRETRLLRAELALSAEDFPAARRAMGAMTEHEPDARVLAVMAAIERGEGASDAVVRGWLAKALTASRGPQWVCGNCHTIHGDWAPLCSNCGAFDSLEWSTPVQSEVVLPAGADMLPLIVGALEKPTADPGPAATTEATAPNSDTKSDIIDAETADEPETARAAGEDSERARAK
ncbi:heme biosynthesis HemY N-terminal domain-containing protein [Citreimonas sp.]|uniref:heme biosynthesis HemY N-terminal domain-containing protein n=1 Tax=Citreimonas sp. TaxID=3036715 RepID=UPI00405929DC